MALHEPSDEQWLGPPNAIVIGGASAVVIDGPGRPDMSERLCNRLSTLQTWSDPPAGGGEFKPSTGCVGLVRAARRSGIDRPLSPMFQGFADRRANRAVIAGAALLPVFVMVPSRDPEPFARCPFVVLSRLVAPCPCRALADRFGMAVPGRPIRVS